MSLCSEDLINYLYGSCYGAQNGQTVRELAEALTGQRSTPGTERQVRKLISSAREHSDHPICATPQDGYYYASTESELRQTASFLRGRAMHSLRLLSRFVRRSLHRFAGQGELPLALPPAPIQLPVQPSTRVSLLVEIPESLHRAIQGYLRDQCSSSVDRLLTTAVTQWLLVQGQELADDVLQYLEDDDAEGRRSGD